MTSPPVAEFLLYAVMLVLPLSALIVRRIPLTQIVKLGGAWVAIFALGLLITMQSGRIRDAFNGLQSSDGANRTTVSIPLAADGHFWVEAAINGTVRRMMIDTGASTTMLTTATAAAAGLALHTSSFPRLVSTANGDVVARRATVARLVVGGIEERELVVLVLPGNRAEVLGMNFLNRLGGWRVANGTLFLTR